ncbi:DUF302 domain-containing protein [Sulfitobacter sabulilitoris]|uniref:DUF302 domain-containing protein n=1 Tax=Sulfitobacter sabulilitoris TaxID=2562655 RepID=A0A5S3PIX8_9RHOB|nr:DUF302 domain-containing protein [Sulfitobacter sabulilitoris]TMM54251.1 DUF302 domain-containing protein [Sulfitobacter sabulilitoris]
MLTRTALAAALGVALVTPATAEMIHKTSPHSVTATMDRLEAAATDAGATVFARIDHAAGAQQAGSDLRPTEVLIFGNPALGTPAMREAQTAGLDLPLRVLAFADAQGAVHLVYRDPANLAAAHGLPGDAEYIAKMTGALSKLTDAAIAE